VSTLPVLHTVTGFKCLHKLTDFSDTQHGQNYVEEISILVVFNSLPKRCQHGIHANFWGKSSSGVINAVSCSSLFEYL